MLRARLFLYDIETDQVGEELLDVGSHNPDRFVHAVVNALPLHIVGATGQYLRLTLEYSVPGRYVFDVTLLPAGGLVADARWQLQCLLHGPGGSAGWAPWDPEWSPSCADLQVGNDRRWTTLG